jgi:CheY-like chemotaxis protein
MNVHTLSEPATLPVSPCILVVEDEMLVAIMVEDSLTDLGYRTIIAGRVGKALELAATAAIDCALLDVNVAGEAIYPVAEALSRRGIPFVFATGYGPGGLRGDYQNRPILAKPFRIGDLQRIMAAALAPPAV